MSKAPFASLSFAPAAVEVERRADGVLVLRSPQRLQAHARCLGEHLERWAREAPERCFLAERAGADWRRLTFGEALVQARSIGAALLARGLSAERPAMVLSDNAIDHALLALGAMHVGVPVAPVSPAYSLMSKDCAKVKGIAGRSSIPARDGWSSRRWRRTCLNTGGLPCRLAIISTARSWPSAGIFCARRAKNFIHLLNALVFCV